MNSMVPLDRPFQRLPVRMWNALAEMTQSNVLAPALSIDGILAEAQTATKLKDFGSCAFREPLNLFLESIEENGNLHSFGRFFLRKFLLGFLCNRLRLQDVWTEHPEILQEEVTRPIFILGLPRTGTTLLFNLLACDADHRYLTGWEAGSSPVPPPDATTYAYDPRRRSSARGIRLMSYLTPHMKTIHEFGVDLPEECTPLLMHEFRSLSLVSVGHIPAYSSWLDTCDYRPTYSYYRKVLQLLQWRFKRERWLLKAPAHLPGVDALLTTFPDACILQPHRDPAKVVPSWCSLNAALRGISARRIDAAELGEQCAHRLAVDLERSIEGRRRHDPKRVYDVNYTQLVRDPIGTIRAVYRHFDLPLREQSVAKMSDKLKRSPKDKHGPHRYSPEHFGLTAGGLRERFATYLDSFNIKAEG